jgi:toxin ParE1/3/4
MAKIRLSRKAIADLDGIWEYTVQTWSEDQAVVYYRQIYNAIQSLDSIPLFLEKKYDIVNPGVLGYRVGHHVIFYKRDKDGTISVDRILHERMDYQRHL